VPVPINGRRSEQSRARVLQDRSASRIRPLSSRCPSPPSTTGPSSTLAKARDDPPAQSHGARIPPLFMRVKCKTSIMGRGEEATNRLFYWDTGTARIAEFGSPADAGLDPVESAAPPGRAELLLGCQRASSLPGPGAATSRRVYARSGWQRARGATPSARPWPRTRGDWRSRQSGGAALRPGSL
jgi:hypothetical protein